MDKYYKYRPLLDIIAKGEGTLPPKRNYNETLSYGAFTGGPVNLVGMTLDQIDQLQTKMLRHPSNKLNSSAVGRYQIVRTTMRNIRKNILVSGKRLTGKELFDEGMQDRFATFLLGQSGIDKWLGGSMSDKTLLNNLAAEWASLPKYDGKGAYSTAGKNDQHVAQNARLTVGQVMQALDEVKKRDAEKVTNEVKKSFDLATWLGGILSGGGLGLGALVGFKWEQLLALAGIGFLFLIVFLVMRKHIIEAIWDAKEHIKKLTEEQPDG